MIVLYANVCECFLNRELNLDNYIRNNPFDIQGDILKHSMIAGVGAVAVGIVALAGCGSGNPQPNSQPESFVCAVFWEPAQQQRLQAEPDYVRYVARSRSTSSCGLWPQPNERETDLDGKLYPAGDSQGEAAATLLAAAEATPVLPAKLAGLPLFLYNNTLVVTGTSVSYLYPEQAGYGRRALVRFEVDDLTRNKPKDFDRSKSKITVTRAPSTTRPTATTRTPASTTSSSSATQERRAVTSTTVPPTTRKTP